MCEYVYVYVYSYVRVRRDRGRALLGVRHLDRDRRARLPGRRAREDAGVRDRRPPDAHHRRARRPLQYHVRARAASLPLSLILSSFSSRLRSSHSPLLCLLVITRISPSCFSPLRVAVWVCFSFLALPFLFYSTLIHLVYYLSAVSSLLDAYESEYLVRGQYSMYVCWSRVGFIYHTYLELPFMYENLNSIPISYLSLLLFYKNSLSNR